MKRLFSLLCLICLLCVTAGIPAMAVNGESFPNLLDGAELLSRDSEEDLNTLLNTISTRQRCAVYIVTVDSLGEYGDDVVSYADDVYDFYGLGYGENHDGILLLLSMGSRDWAISTCGYGLTAFTDYGQSLIMDDVLPFLSGGSYENAFRTFASRCDQYLTQAHAGTPVDIGEEPKEPLSSSWIPLSLAIGFVIALMVTGSMKNQLTSVSAQSRAGQYVKKNSLALSDTRDTFLYRNVTRTAINQNTGSRGGSGGHSFGGGSSSHISSSGVSHGGSHGKF